MGCFPARGASLRKTKPGLMGQRSRKRPDPAVSLPESGSEMVPTSPAAFSPLGKWLRVRASQCGWHLPTTLEREISVVLVPVRWMHPDGAGPSQRKYRGSCRLDSSGGPARTSKERSLSGSTDTTPENSSSAAIETGRVSKCRKSLCVAMVIRLSETAKSGSHGTSSRLEDPVDTTAARSKTSATAAVNAPTLRHVSERLRASPAPAHLRNGSRWRP